MQKICGFVSPKGEYVPCKSFGHMHMASVITKRDYNKKINGYAAEEFLLDNGWLEINTHGAIFRINISDDSPNFITEEQELFIKENQLNFISSMQLESTLHMIELSNDLERKYRLDEERTA